MFGLPFRFRQSSFDATRAARARPPGSAPGSPSPSACSRAPSASRAARSAPRNASPSPRCSCMIRVISSPTIVESSSLCAMMSGIDARNESFSSASSTIEDILALSITESAMAQRVAQASVTAVGKSCGWLRVGHGTPSSSTRAAPAENGDANMTLIRAAHPSLPRAWTPVRRLDEGACAEEGCPCAWRDGLELLCGVRCDPPEHPCVVQQVRRRRGRLRQRVRAARQR